MPAQQPAEPKGISGSDALTRCLNILDHVEDEGDDHYTGDLSPRSRVIRALAAFYDVPMTVTPAPNPDDR